MDEEVKKIVKTVNNDAYKERFQFLFWVGDNIICQRYFRIGGFNPNAVESFEFTDTMNRVVDMIQQDLVSKSRVIMWCTRNEPMKLVGFVNDDCKINGNDLFVLTSPKISGKVELSNGDIIDKEYIEYPDEAIDDKYTDNERPDEWETTFKFQFLIDDEVKYERIWDGNVYPKYIRNSVDLSNSDARFRDKEPSTLGFNASLGRSLVIGRNDLVYHSIKKICETLSGHFDENDYYTKSEKYGNKKYYYSTYNTEWVNNARKATQRKTNIYESGLAWDEEHKGTFGLTDKQWEYIETKL